ncbi:xanthine/CO dehydrogenase XdhC/CoxF family maturation factor [Kitasatospora sp. GP82]|nr:xanthine/CO dehydrogenase XdhC/CoxF family maturation factor [Kitasatospora sp. GP82]
MQDIADQLRSWSAAGRAFALASVVSVQGSAPRRAGAALAVDSDGEVVGSVSGGCVEAAVYELCQEVLRAWRPNRVTVCDARPVFATARRFPAAHEVVVDWAHRYLDAEEAAGRLDARTVLCCAVLSDPRPEVRHPLLERALRLPVGYVGAMGSRHVHRERLERLREAGLARQRSPIGLDLCAGTPEETAVSIAAEIVGLQRGGTFRPLGATSTSIRHGGARADRRAAAPPRPPSRTPPSPTAGDEGEGAVHDGLNRRPRQEPSSGPAGPNRTGSVVQASGSAQEPGHGRSLEQRFQRHLDAQGVTRLRDHP